MEKFLGVLFCGGRGTRLGKITEYVSKSLLPVYDTPSFMFGLSLLKKSDLISEIVLLTNKSNDFILKDAGYRTIIQDDNFVKDMFTGWEYIKQQTGTKAHGVLVPSDNICKVSIDKLIRVFATKKPELLFMLHRLKDRKKLSDMGSFDLKKGKYSYRNPNPESNYGVIAPYIVRNDLNLTAGKNIFESPGADFVHHSGYWFDIGDYASLLKASAWRSKNSRLRF